MDKQHFMDKQHSPARPPLVPGLFPGSSGELPAGAWFPSLDSQASPLLDEVRDEGRYLLEDTLTEMEGLARNPCALDAYAGSF